MFFVLSKHFRTEGFRLSAIYTLVFALSVALIGFIVLATVREALLDQVISSARKDIRTLQIAYTAKGIPEVLETIEQLGNDSENIELFLIQKDGAKIAGNLPEMPPRLGIIRLNKRGPARVLGIGAELGPGVYAFVGTHLHRVYIVQQRLIRILLWMSAAGFLLAVAGGILVSRSFLRRTDAMATTCQTIMNGNLSARLPVRGTRDELDRLALSVNAMLDRIAVLMENIRQITNDIAHDLRTPLTHLRRRLESGRDEAPDAKSRAAFDAALEKTDEILAMFGALLGIVQIGGGNRRNAFKKIELSGLLEQLREMFAPVAEAEQHSLILQSGKAVSINGDRALLLQLFSNLIENAIIHTPAGTRVFLRLAALPDSVAVIVSDDGPGVPQEEHSKLFRRLYRREASRTTPGYGLGLSLAAAIAELHGAHIEIEPENQGFSVRVTFDVPPA